MSLIHSTVNLYIPGYNYIISALHWKHNFKENNIIKKDYVLYTSKKMK
jgi:hypothetical protein